MPFGINHYLHFTCLSAGSAAEIKTGATANTPIPLPVFLVLNVRCPHISSLQTRRTDVELIYKPVQE